MRGIGVHSFIKQYHHISVSVCRCVCTTYVYSVEYICMRLALHTVQFPKQLILGLRCVSYAQKLLQSLILSHTHTHTHTQQQNVHTNRSTCLSSRGLDVLEPMILHLIT